MVNHIGDTIRKRRKQLAMTQPYLAELAGVSINTLYKIERNEGNPTLDVLNRIALILGMELNLNIIDPNKTTL